MTGLLVLLTLAVVAFGPALLNQYAAARARRRRLRDDFAAIDEFDRARRALR